MNLSKPSQLFIFCVLLASVTSAQTNSLPSTGNVGIGTTTPATLLDVNGNSTFRNILTMDFGTANRKIQLKDNGIFMSRLTDGGFQSSITADGSMSYNTRNDHKFFSNSVQILTLKEAGYLGIGTTNPTIPLHVQAASGANIMRLSNGTYHTDFVQNSYLSTINASSGFVINWGSGANKSEMRLDVTSGKGQFYLSPVYGAFVNGFGGFKVAHNEKLGFYTHESTASYGAIGSVYTSNNNWGLSFFTRNQGTEAQAAQFSSAGNFMVGTTTDNGNKLQVSGNIWASGLILPTGAGNGKVLTSDATGTATWQTAATANTVWNLSGNAGTTSANNFIGTTDAQPFVIRTNNAPAITVLANGNVGIGTANIGDAAYKLYVQGSIRTRKVRVDQDTWADYVFEDGYNLPSLEEVETFIKSHGHLKDVVSAKEIREKGLDLGENQRDLLKKIEELTLYVIEQNKQIKAQQMKEETLLYKVELLEEEIKKIKAWKANE